MSQEPRSSVGHLHPPHCKCRVCRFNPGNRGSSPSPPPVIPPTRPPPGPFEMPLGTSNVGATYSRIPPKPREPLIPPSPPPSPHLVGPIRNRPSSQPPKRQHHIDHYRSSSHETPQRAESFHYVYTPPTEQEQPVQFFAKSKYAAQYEKPPQRHSAPEPTPDPIRHFHQTIPQRNTFESPSDADFAKFMQNHFSRAEFVPVHSQRVQDAVKNRVSYLVSNPGSYNRETEWYNMAMYYYMSPEIARKRIEPVTPTDSKGVLLRAKKAKKLPLHTVDEKLGYLLAYPNEEQELHWLRELNPIIFDKSDAKVKRTMAEWVHEATRKNRESLQHIGNKHLGCISSNSDNGGNQPKTHSHGHRPNPSRSVDLNRQLLSRSHSHGYGRTKPPRDTYLHM